MIALRLPFGVIDLVLILALVTAQSVSAQADSPDQAWQFRTGVLRVLQEPSTSATVAAWMLVGDLPVNDPEVLSLGRLISQSDGPSAAKFALAHRNSDQKTSYGLVARQILLFGRVEGIGTRHGVDANPDMLTHDTRALLARSGLARAIVPMISEADRSVVQDVLTTAGLDVSYVLDWMKRNQDLDSLPAHIVVVVELVNLTGSLEWLTEDEYQYLWSNDQVLAGLMESITDKVRGEKEVFLRIWDDSIKSGRTSLVSRLARKWIDDIDVQERSVRMLDHYYCFSGSMGRFSVDFIENGMLIKNAVNRDQFFEAVAFRWSGMQRQMKHVTDILENESWKKPPPDGDR